MKGVYLYALVDAGVQPPAGLTGVDQAAVRTLSLDGFDVWYSEAERVPQASVERLRRHNDVVTSALGFGETPLPLRFGQWLPDLEAARSRLGRQAEAHRRRLREVAGAVEFGVRVAAPAASRRLDQPPATQTSAGGGPGARYLQAAAARLSARADRDDRGVAVARELRESLGDCARAERLTSAAQRVDLLEVAHLVPRDRQNDYRDRVRDVRVRHPDLRFLVTGPWPPYSFANE